MFLGNALAKRLRMPDHSWKFSLALGTLAAAAVIVSLGEIKFGPDLSGGITLIYELQNTSAEMEGDQGPGASARAPGAPDSTDGTDAGEEKNTAQDDSSSENSNSQGAPRRNTGNLVEQLIAALRERVDPSGTKEVTIRKYGESQIEIIIPRTGGQQEMDYIMRRISTAGALEFRITASPEFSENRSIIEVAQKLAPGINDVQLEGHKVAEWVAYDLQEFGPVDQPDNRVVKRMAGKIPQALVLTNDGQNVTGDYLRSATAGLDQRGGPAVNFTFNLQGAYRFSRLTGEHLPNPSGQRYNLGIVLDKKLISAPSIESQIRDQGQIHGNFTKEEVDFLIGILNAGSLPAALNKEPISSATISPTLGAETVEKGRRAIVFSLMIVMVFMLIYYRFAGLVACMALGANLLLILGLMILLKAAFTLPGLAGLVLTIGMSVDANVLIFERIREELSRGSALRMAIRNGFSRATRTIVDANVTTLITAIVIYKIAPDNVKGFGVTLILGILMSMYTAIFLSRIVFDIAERTRRLKALGMRHLVGHTNIDFIGKCGLAAVFSLLIIAIGLAGIASRGNDLLNIDFTGGSSVTMVLKDDQKLPYAEVKNLLAETELADKNLSLVEVGETDTRYTVSSVEQDIHAAQELLHTTFGDRLKTHQVELDDLHALAGPQGDDGGNDPFAGGTSVRVKFQVAGFENEDTGVNHDTVQQFVQDALARTGHEGIAIDVTHPMYQPGSARRFGAWDVKLALPEGQTQEVLESLQITISNQPLYPLSNKIGGRVAGNMKTAAIAAVLASLAGIVAYIWFRFHGVIYGLAAVVALVHDVAVTMGAIALSAYLVGSMGPFASGLMIEKFQISLPIVAALLTIIGYSLNDTIVVFDRIREVKGKSPRLSAEMINKSINQTLSRTLLTSLTTLLTVLILYFIGGDGIHGFAFSLVVGVIVGTYSSIFVASPILLWLSDRATKAAAKAV
jgi:SecD/SecF fusion protein